MGTFQWWGSCPLFPIELVRYESQSALIYLLLELLLMEFDLNLVTYIFSSFQYLSQRRMYWAQALLARLYVFPST